MDFTDLYFTRYGVITQLMCGGIFSNNFITNFPQNVPVKNSTLGDDRLWTKICGLTSSFE